METLIWRLEQVVGKLEDFTSRWCIDGIGYPSSVDVATSPTSREEMTYKNGSPGCVDKAAGGVASWSVVYDQLMSGPLLSYLKASQRIGDDVLTQATLVEGVFSAQRKYLMASARQAKTSQSLNVETLYRAMAEKLTQVQEFRDKKRGTPYFNHLSTISESVSALGWVTMNAEGSVYVGAMIDAGQFFANRVLLDFKKDPIHGEWVNAWFETLTQLQSYANEFHPTGVRLDSSKRNGEHVSERACQSNVTQQSVTTVIEPSIHPSVSAILPAPKCITSDRWHLKKRQSNPETSATQRREIEDILLQVTNDMHDLKQSMCSATRTNSAKPPPIPPEHHLNLTKSSDDDQQQQLSNKHFFTKLRPTGLKLTSEPSEMPHPLNVVSDTKPDYNYSTAFPAQTGFNSNCSHPANPDQPATSAVLRPQFQPASEGNSRSGGNSDGSQWLSSKSPSQASPSYASKQTSQVVSSSSPTNTPSQSYPNSVPSRFNQSASTDPPSQSSLSSQGNNRQPRFNASYPTTPVASLAPSQLRSSAPVIPLSNSSPACLASQASQSSPSCHSKSSYVSKTGQMVLPSSQCSVNLLPPSESSRRTTRSETKSKQDKVPQCYLNGKKWIVEYYNGVKDLVVDVADIRESVYIFDCNDCIIRVNGKTSAITIDNCKRTGLIFDETISSLEIVNCQSIQAQAMVKVSAVSADKTDGCTVFLSHQSLNARIITSKSSAVNILYPNEHGEFREYPVPEQFCSQWNGDHLVTDLSDPRRHA